MRISRTKKSVTARGSYSERSALWILAAGAGVLLGLLSCSGGPVCKELGNCGGNPVGTWAQRPAEEENAKYCQEKFHLPPLDEYLQRQPTPVARMRLPESTNIDWCYNLVLTAEEVNALKSNLYWWENFTYSGGLVTYKENGEYTVDFGRQGMVSRYYSRTCLSQYGHEADCAKFQERLVVANQGASEYDFFDCKEDVVKGGCNCQFLIAEANAQAGVYTIQGSTITHFPNTPPTHFTQAVTCVQGDTMEISGRNNSFLWDRQSLRTIELVRLNCEDGKQGPGEAGVDCGLGCPNTCQE